MKLYINLISLLLLLANAGELLAQTGRGKITSAEFFFDTDPGQGAATALTLQGNLNDVLRKAVHTASLGLPAGKHTLNVRFKDSLNHWCPVFKTTLSVESPATGRSFSMTLARMYWDANIAGATNMIMLNGNVNNIINTFVNTSPLSTFSTPGSHKINIQVMEANGQWSPAFTTQLKVESPATFTRVISASLGRAYWDNNLGSAVGLIILNGNATNAINQFTTASPLSSFGTASSHKLNVQLLDPNGSNNYGQVFSTTVRFDTTLNFTRIISAALGNAWWDNNTASSVGLIILNGNAGNAVNEFVSATPMSTFSSNGLHKLNVQLIDPNGSGNYSPTFTTAIHINKAIDTVRAIRVDAARVWFDNAIPASPNMLAFDGNFNDPLEQVLHTLPAPSIGLHTLNVQIRDSFPTHWGPIFKTSFVVEAPLSYRNINVATGQMYWDNDTLNNPLTLLAFDGAFDHAVESALKDSVPTLPSGMHNLCVRFKDVAGNWSNPFRLSITIEDSLFARNIKVVQGEVRVDNTPPLTILALNANFNQALETAQATLLSSGIPTGLHRLLVRMKGLEGNWGPYFITSLLVSPCATAPLPTVTHNRPLTFCYGDSTVLTANPGFASYTWISNNTVVGTGQSFVARDSASYVVVVTDATNCPGASAPKNVVVHHPIVNISTGPVFCSGSIDSLIATPGFSSYSWSGGGNTNKKYISAAGSYTVTVTDANGCTATSSILINAVAPPPIPFITASGPLSFCTGSSVTLTSSVSSNIVWSNGLTSPSIVVDSAGSFRVTVTGANGCKSSSAYTTTYKHPLTAATISVNGPTTFCDGSIVVLSSYAGQAYNWSNGASTQSISATSTGTYSLVLIDSNGCPSNSIGIPVAVNPNPSIPVVTASGPLSFCNGLSVVLTASLASNYSWNNGVTTQSQTIYASGTFVDTVTNSFGCKSWSLPTVVDVHPVAAISASGPTTFCMGDNVTLTASPSSGVSYLWSNASTNPSVNITTSQNLSVIVTETGTGCKDTAFQNVIVNPLPTGNISTTGLTTVCSGNTVTFNATGSANTKFRWFRNGSPVINYFYNIYCSCLVPYFIYGNSFGATTDGVYSAEIIDTLTGCVAMTNTINATFITPPVPIITANGGTTLCIGANTTLSSTPAVSYLWSTGATTQQIVAATQGNYIVTITDMNGCTRSSAPTPVSFYPNAGISASGPTTFCAGGSVNLSAYPTGTYLWSNGSTNASITNITTSGTYSLTVTDVNGCSSNANPVSIVVNPLPSGSITAVGPTTVCSGVAANFTTNGSPNCIYKWYRNGAAIYYLSYNYNCNCNVPIYTYGNTFSTITGGTYSAEIIDTLTGCSSMTNGILVTVLPLPLPAITQTAFIDCPGNQTAALQSSASGTVAPYNFAWSTGANSSAINALGAGTYQVTVTDAIGCSNTLSYTVNQPSSVTAFASSPVNTRGYNVSCYGSSDGSATVYPGGGTPPYTYLWSTGATTASINGLSAGTYNVTVSDANNCPTSTTTVTLVQPSAVNLTLSPSVFYGGKNISCFGGSNGSISALPSGGTANFTYLWSNGQTAQTASSLIAGTYSVVATDSVGCSTNASITLQQPSPLANVLTPSVYSGYNVSCNGRTDGAITLNPSGGTTPYHYFWSDTNTNQNRSSLGAGMYKVTLYDTLGCSRIDSIVMTQPTAIITSLSATVLNCYGDSNGVITSIVNGGNGPYTYVWDNGATTANPSNLKAGFYLVTVTDSRGCTKVDQAQVTQPTQVTGYAFGTYIGCGSQIGLLSVTGSGGFSPYNFLWSNGSAASFQTNQPLGSYSVTVTDAHGCWDTSMAIILSPPTLSASMSNDYHASCDSITTVPAGTLTVTPSGGVTPYLYLWSNGATTPTIQQLGTGNYTCIVTDANGCTATPTGHVYNNDPAVILGNPVVCIGNSTTTLSTIPSSLYTWSNAGGVISTNQSVAVGPGTYTLTATNLNGCVNSSSITVTSGQCEAIIDLTLYLQSYYAGLGFMHPVLYNQGESASLTVTDTITVQLRNAQPPHGVASSIKTVLNTNGTAHCVFPPISGHYYIAVNHRSTLATWSADSILIGPIPTTYIFSDVSSKAYGDNMTEVESGVWAFYSGDVNLDENLDLLDLILIGNDINNFAYGYYATDLNGDGNVDLLDPASVEDNITNFIYSNHP